MEEKSRIKTNSAWLKLELRLSSAISAGLGLGQIKDYGRPQKIIQGGAKSNFGRFLLMIIGTSLKGRMAYNRVSIFQRGQAPHLAPPRDTHVKDHPSPAKVRVGAELGNISNIGGDLQRTYSSHKILSWCHTTSKKVKG